VDPIILTQTKWSESLHVPVYLFFGSLTAGTFIVAVLADWLGLRWSRFRTLSRVAAIASVPLLAIAGVALTSHLGKPERGMAFPLFFTNYNSWMTRGGWVVGAAAPLIVVYAAMWWFGAYPRVRRVVGLVGIPLGAGLSMYTGALLAGAMFVPLWSMQHLPLLFLNSGLTTGLAFAGLAFAVSWPFVRDAEDSARPVLLTLAVALVVTIAVELWELHGFMSYLASDPRSADPTGRFTAPIGGRLAYEMVTAGALAPWFWIGIVGVGLGAPLVLTLPELALSRWATPIAAVKFVLVLAGGFILRWVIVQGGELKAPLPFPPSKWPIPGIGG
jgi:formate-dependent nitrite reductase membrane component NrfD